MKKGCTDIPLLLLDDGTEVDVVGVCEIRNTVASRNYIKLCNDANFCNNYCNAEVTIEPLQPTIEPPQRQPTVTCYECDSYGGECFTERQQRQSTGTIYVRKSCTNVPFVEYPDNRASTALNTCESRIIDDIQYQVRVCNAGNYCNVACPMQDEQLVNCYQCEATNQADCTTGSCQGRYCLFSEFYRKQLVNCYQCEATNQADCTTGSCQGRYCLFTRTQTSLGIQIKKSCSNTNELLYPDNGRYASFGICEYRQINFVNYDYKLCNTSSYCNTACPAGPFSTTTFAPLTSTSSWDSRIASILIPIILYLLAR
ncbi:unnamed protein product [Strongylus vulgaris]|uniref:Uncharacterized protein n=1 Tax=Strongylus vulgaris TaxID=40348 RepID=A0A3P7LBH6_STRVU|nr:unnamed protein product [Strongylus vulgaris]